MLSKQSGYRGQVRDEIIISMASLLSDSTNPNLLKALRFSFPRMSFALIINWIPEQGEDIYWILIDSQRVAAVEVPRGYDIDIDSISMEVLQVSEYRKRRLSAETRRKLSTALNLMREKEREAEGSHHH